MSVFEVRYALFSVSMLKFLINTYFSCISQAQNYDPDGEYVAHWIPEIARLPKFQRHSPGRAYLKPVVPLKFSAPRQSQNPRAGSNTFLKSSGNRSGGGRRDGGYR